MRHTLRFAASALVAGLIGLSPAMAQQPKPEAELKKAQEQLEKLLKELRDQEAKKPAPPAPPAPPTAAKPMIFTIPAQQHNSGDPMAAIKGLLKSSDPKTVALAKELLEQLAKTSPKPPAARVVEGAQLQFQIQPEGKPSGQLELKFGDSPKAKPSGNFELQLEGVTGKPGGQFEFKVVPQPGTPKAVETKGIVVVMGEGNKAAGPSTLKLSADGKTAAVLGADGAMTIFDVVSGKELMKFPGKK